MYASYFPREGGGRGLQPGICHEDIRTFVGRMRSAWCPEWGEPDAWTAELTWSQEAATDRLVTPIRERYAVDRGRPASDLAA